MKNPGDRTALAVGLVAVLCLVFAGAPLVAHAAPAAATLLKPVPTSACACASQTASQGSAIPNFRGHGPPNSSALYDEQLGLTFTQSFTSMEYNVTAVEQTDQTLGDGPAYLLNGLSNVGYWYQVGVSWNWNPGAVPGTGFDLNFEVFDNGGNSVFPTNQQGGVDAFSGPVNAGDQITLNLYFSTANHEVVMLADDIATGATASEVYSDMGATDFVGLPNSVADENGFFTGLMTEWYHGGPYYANEAEVIYSNPGFGVSSAWMWMDEFNPNTLTSVFSATPSAPVSFTSPNALQEFSFNGTTEYSDSFEFVTGAMNASAPPPPPAVPLTLSFTVQGAALGSSPPILSYVANGTAKTAPLTETPSVFMVDAGSTWSVSSTLGGSTTAERFATDQPTSGPAKTPEAVEFLYFTQFEVLFGYSVAGGGIGPSAPTIQFTSFASSNMTTGGNQVWADAGTAYHYQDVLFGSNVNERWHTNSTGTVVSSQVVAVTYYHEYLASFNLSFADTEVPPAVALTSTSAGDPYTTTLVQGPNQEWLDSGSTYSLPQSFSLSAGERLITNATVTGTVSARIAVQLAYAHQFFIGVSQDAPNGGTTSLSSGWYDSGSTLQISAVASTGFQFAGWNGTGQGSVSTTNSSLSLTVGPQAPVNETAAFDPGVSIVAQGLDGVSYSDGQVSGTVPAGKSAEVFVPPSSNLTLTSIDTALLSSFGGWTGAINSHEVRTSLLVSGPVAVTANSSYDYSLIAILVLLAASALVVVTAVVLTRRKSPAPQPF